MAPVQLYENEYDTGKALQVLAKNPLPKALERKWTDEDIVCSPALLSSCPLLSLSCPPNVRRSDATD